jgi:PAS domain S-box-containing protein
MSGSRVADEPSYAPVPRGPTEPSAVELQVSEILDSFDEAFCAFDADWKIIHCNQAAERHVGMPRALALGRLYWEVVPSALGGELERTLRQAMETGASVEAEMPSVLRPGATISLRVFRFQDGLAISFRDITRRRQRQQAVREQAVRLDLAMAAAGLGDWSWDIGGDLVTLSPRAAVIFGLPAGPMLTWTTIQSLINPADRERMVAAVMGALEAGGGYEVEYRIRPPGSAEELWVQSRGEVQHDAEGRPTGIIGVVSDISAAKARDARLRESEARFAMMADSAPVPMWVTTASGRIEFVNSAYCEFAGLDRETLLGDGWVVILHPEDVPLLAAARATARRALAPFTIEVRFRNAAGEWRWMSVVSRPRFDEDGAFQGYAGVGVDLTDIKAAEARQQLMINELNHRVKNTLATVQSLALQTARMAGSKEEFKDKFLARLMALNAAHGRLTQTSWEWTPMADVVADQLGVHGPDARLTAEGPAVSVSPRAALSISLALHELATNAVKYGALGGDHGRVTLTWGVRAGEGGGQTVDLEWREEGGPLVTAPEARGFGSRLLETVGRELGGEARLAFEPTGLRWTVKFPRGE